MAADRITVGLDLDSRQAQREVARLQKQIDALSKSMGGAMKGVGAGGGGDKVRALGTGLSKATVRADEFTKSLEASNARVIAFGASAGLIMQVDRALKAMVSSAIKVEKAMADVNVVMNASTKTLDKFGRGMFKVAKETAQGFDTVAEAATELARQGLGMEQTLSRTKDALILTRLTGMNAADAVKSLTAAVNSFNKEGVTSAQVINKMAKVDAAFAVSSEDLAKSISRVGSSAVDAGVSLDQLMAITTAVQQKTARGGAVIGNAFKTIFTRIQRSDVQKKLKDIGVATTDMNGKMLDGVTVLENLSRSFGTLTKAQQASVGESVAGVFQINILKAAMSDLVNVNSEYSRSLRISNTATNEAYQRNLELNKTLDSLVNRSMANLTSAGAGLGGGAFEPAIRKVLGTLNTAIESFGKGGMMEGVGETVGKGLLTGIGNFIAGPGLIMVGAAITKLGLNLAKFAGTALKDFMGLNVAAKQRASLEEITLNKLREQPSLITKIATGETTIATIQKDILKTMKLQTLERAQQATIAKTLATGMYAGGARVSPAGSASFIGPVRPGKAGGFIPNFASAGAERAAASAGGYRAGAIRTMSQPGAGTMMYNSAETVKQFPGMSQKAIMPPANSAAGAGYKAAFGAAHGFNPYAANGFVPNFNVLATARAGEGFRQRGAGLRKSPGVTKGKSKEFDPDSHFGALIAQGGHLTTNRIAMLVPSGKGSGMGHGTRGNAPYNNFSASFPVHQWSPQGLKAYGSKSGAVPDVSEMMTDAAVGIVRNFAAKVKPPADPKLISGDKTETRLMQTGGGKGALEGAAGAVFEAGMALALGVPAAAQETGRSRGDFDLRPRMFGGNASMAALRGSRQIFGAKFSMADFKISQGDDSRSSMVAKMAKELVYGGAGAGLIKHSLEGRKGKSGKILGKTKAMGFVPNFSPLTSAVGREMAAGVPASAIRVGSSPALRSSANPGGVGVFNTIDEPSGLNQGINRSRAMGINPKSHGAAGGFVPNFIGGSIISGSRTLTDASAMSKLTRGADKQLEAGGEMKDASGRMMMAGMMINMALSGAASSLGASPQLQSGANVLANVGGTAMMGAAFGPAGIAAGAALGAATSLGDIDTMLGGKNAEIAAAQFEATSKVFTESIDGITVSMKKLTSGKPLTGAEKLEGVKNIIDRTQAILDAQKGGIDIPLLGINTNEIVNKIFGESEGSKQLNQSKQDLLNLIDIKELRRTGGKGMTAADMSSIKKLLQETETQLGVAAQAEGQGRLFGARQTFDRTKGLGMETLMNDPLSLLMGIGGVMAASTRTEGFKKAEAQDIGKIFRERAGMTGASAQKILELTPEETGMRFAGQRGGMEGAGGARAISNIRSQVEEGLRLQDQGKLDGATDVLLKANKLVSNLFKASGNVVEAKAFANRGEEGDLRKISSTLAGLFSFRGAVGPTAFGGGGRNFLSDKGDGSGSLLMGLTQGGVDRSFRQAQMGLVTSGLDSKFGSAARISRLSRGGARRALNRTNEGRMAGMTMAGEGLIDEQSRISRLAVLDKEETQRATINIQQKEKLEQKEIASLASLVSEIKKSGMGLKQQNDFIESYNQEYKKLTDNEIERRIRAIEDDPSLKESSMGSKQIAELKFLKTLQTDRVTNLKETNHLQGENIKNRKAENENITATNKARKEELKAIQTFQKAQFKQNIINQRFLTASTASGLRDLKNEGLGITETEIAGAGKKARRAAIRAGTSRGNPGQAFREAFAYGDTNAILEFEDGVVSVANSMKSSFSSAFQSIASGADTVGGAIANMANGILNSISQVSTNMFTNMLFSGLGPGKAQGGYIPGYNAGGLVTGGSGNKDDVLTRMRGGEFVIKKSAVNKIGLPALNAINGYANGGPTMGQMGLVAAGSTAAASMIGAAMQPGSPSPAPSQNYGYGRGSHGYFGGPDPDARGGDVFSGGGGRAGVSLNKAFVYYRRDPQTGQLVSERARPTEGRFEVSRSLSLLGRLGADDPQTARMFEKEQAMGKYQGYLASETQRRSDAVDAVKKQKRGRLISAYMNAAMLIGGAKFMDSRNNPASASGGYGEVSGNPPEGFTPPYDPRLSYGPTPSAYERGFPVAHGDSFTRGGPKMPSVFNTPTGRSTFQGLDPMSQKLINFGNPGNANGGMARVMGGEYIMSPEAVRTHGVGFMTELNRGNVPGYASGGLVGGGGAGMVAGGAMTNNVNINVNIDKNGKATAESDATSGKSGPSERDQQEEVENNKELGKLLQGVVVQEIVKQQRPGGLLNRGTTGVRSGGY